MPTPNPDLTTHILDFVEQHPKMDADYDWYMFEGVLAFRLGLAPAVPNVAEYRNLVTRNPNLQAAPVGALHHFDVPPYGHIVIDVYGGGGIVLVVHRYGLKYERLTEYIAQSRHRYLGWTSHIEGAGA